MEINSSMLLDAGAPFRAGAEAGLPSPLPGGTGTEDVGQQFESLFVSMMLKEMRQSMSEEGLFAGDGADVYGGLFDMFLGQHVASQGAFGIADLLKAQTTTATGAAAATTEVESAPATSEG
jgi:Rod binding domain-containing protein